MKWAETIQKKKWRLRQTRYLDNSVGKSPLQSQILQTCSTKLDNSSKSLNYRLVLKDTIELEPYILKVPPRFYLHIAKLRKVITGFLANAVAGSDELNTESALYVTYTK